MRFMYVLLQRNGTVVQRAVHASSRASKCISTAAIWFCPSRGSSGAAALCRWIGEQPTKASAPEALAVVKIRTDMGIYMDSSIIYISINLCVYAYQHGSVGSAFSCISHQAACTCTLPKGTPSQSISSNSSAFTHINTTMRIKSLFVSVDKYFCMYAEWSRPSGEEDENVRRQRLIGFLGWSVKPRSPLASAFVLFVFFCSFGFLNKFFLRTSGS